MTDGGKLKTETLKLLTMNAAAAARLEDLIGVANPVTVELVQIQECAMTPSLIRQRFAAATCIDINESGMGARNSDGSWLWIGTQPGGPR